MYYHFARKRADFHQVIVHEKDKIPTKGDQQDGNNS